MDILKHYGFVVGAQNQIINIHNFVMQSSSSNISPTIQNTQINSIQISNASTTAADHQQSSANNINNSQIVSNTININSSSINNNQSTSIANDERRQITTV